MDHRLKAGDGGVLLCRPSGLLLRVHGVIGATANIALLRSPEVQNIRKTKAIMPF
jgi:hypothetical protein